MSDIFEPKSITPEIEKLRSPRIYNRSERRKGAFVIVNGKNQFGRWNKLMKQLDWEEIPLQYAAMYSYDTIVKMFKVDITRNLTVVKVKRGTKGERVFDI